MASIKEIKGIQITHAEKLIGDGIKTTDQLIEAAATKRGRRDLAKRLEIPQKIILQWVTSSDLFRIKGVGKKYLDLLEGAGVGSVAELSKKKPNVLLSQILEVNQNKKLVQRTPKLSEIESWIEQSKKLPAKIEK